MTESSPDGALKSASTWLTQLLDDGSDRRFRELIQALFGVAARMTAMREKIGAIAGVSGPHYSMLVTLRQLAGDGPGVPVNALAAQLFVSGTYVTAESKKLEALGLVERAPHPTDGRSVLLRLSPLGRERMESVLPHVRAVNDALFGGLDRAGFEQLRAQALKLVASGDEALLVAERELRRANPPA